MKCSLVCLMLTLVSCAGMTPTPVLHAGELTTVGLDVLQGNVDAIVDAYDAKLREAYKQGLMAAYETNKNAMLDAEGKLDAAQHDQLLMQLAARMDANNAWLDNEKEQTKNKLRLQFSTIQQLNAKVQEYNKAAGIPPGSISALVEATTGIAEEIAAQRNTDASSPTVDVLDVVREIGQNEYKKFLQRRSQAASSVNSEQQPRE